MKEWGEPQLFDLSVRETMGGPNKPANADGPAVYDQNHREWWIPAGQS